MKFLSKDYWLKATPEAVKKDIAEGADVNARNKYGFTPLMIAGMWNEYPEIIAILKNSGADVNAQTDHGMTPLMEACWYNKEPNIIIALVDHGADVKVKDEEGRTAWDYINMNKKLRDTYACNAVQIQ